MSSEVRDYGGEGAPTHLTVSTSPLRPTHIDLEAQSPTSRAGQTEDKLTPPSPVESVRNRRPTRSSTVKTYHPERRGQGREPEQEPGIDTSAHAHPLSFTPELHEHCGITVIDYSQDDIRLQNLDNDSLGPFLDQGRPGWASCRWISINGLSWDVIKLLGNHKHLHRLAIEDLLNARNRTKADWYSDHTYMVLPLQKLIHFHADTHCDSDCSEWDDGDTKPKTRKKKKQKRSFLPFAKRDPNKQSKDEPRKSFDSSVENGFVMAHSPPKTKVPATKVHTLQRFHGGPNEERIEFMEKHSAVCLLQPSHSSFLSVRCL